MTEMRSGAAGTRRDVRRVDARRDVRRVDARRDVRRVADARRRDGADAAREVRGAADTRRDVRGAADTRRDVRRASDTRRDVRRACVALVVVAIVRAATAGAAPYDRAARIAHLATALDAFRKIGAGAPATTAGDGVSAFERDLHEAIRVKCADKALRCMIEVATARCAGDAACLAAADIVVTNQHAERDLVDEPTRMRLVRTSSDYHAAVLAELRTRYAVLAAELSISPPDPSLAARIDKFCVERDLVARRCVPNAPACVGTIAYQRCAAGLVWFASTTAAAGSKP